MGINIADPEMVNAWSEFSVLHPEQWQKYDGGCGCEGCAKYRRDFHCWFDAERAAEAEGGEA